MIRRVMNPHNYSTPNNQSPGPQRGYQHLRVHRPAPYQQQSMTRYNPVAREDNVVSQAYTTANSHMYSMNM